MRKQPGGLESPSLRKRQEWGQQPQPQMTSTPIRGTGATMPCSSPPTSKRAAGCKSRFDAARCTTSDAEQPPPAAASLQALERAVSLLREAVVDAGSPAAALVPLRPSLRRIKDDLVRLLNEAVSSQNGNASLLVLGPPGTGKSLVVERALQEVCTKHNGLPSSGTAPAGTTAASTATADPPAAVIEGSVRNVGIVRLNGLLQPDERTAFQEVAMQLCRDFGHKFVKSATFDENLVFLKGMLHALYKCLKKVVFVVDEFQQYAKKGKQQMLYYLLDMLQDSRIQTAVIGISSAHNVAEDLEKRVLSRVGRRRVYVTFPTAPIDEVAGGPTAGNSPGGSGGDSALRSPNIGNASNADNAGADSYDGLLYDMLALHPGMADFVGLSEAAVKAHNGALTETLRDSRIVECLSKMELIGAPPQHVALAAEVALAAWGDELWRRRQKHEGAAGLTSVEQLKGRQGGGGDRATAVLAVMPPTLLGTGHLLAALQVVTDAPERALADVVSGLPVLSLVLLVAAHRLSCKGQSLCNFEMVWDEYRSIQGQRGAITFNKEAAAAAWQALPLSGLAHYSDANVETRGRDLAYAGVVLLVGSSDLDLGIRRHPHCPDAVTRFHMQEI